MLNTKTAINEAYGIFSENASIAGLNIECLQIDLLLTRASKSTGSTPRQSNATTVLNFGMSSAVYGRRESFNISVKTLGKTTYPQHIAQRL